MEPQNGGLEDEFPRQRVIFRFYVFFGTIFVSVPNLKVFQDK